MTPREQEFYQQLLAAFRGEADEHVRVIGQELLRLEKLAVGTAAPGEFETLFRAAHSFKGAARAVNAGAIESLCHEVESVVARWKKGAATAQPQAYDAIHQAVELMARFLAKPAEPPQGEEAAALTATLEALRRLAAADPVTPVPPAPATAPTPVPADPPRAAPVAPPSSVALPAEARSPGDAAVRMPLRKLEQLLGQSEELLLAEQAMRQRAIEQQELAQQFVAWDRRWAAIQRVRRELETLVQRGGEVPLRTELLEILDFVDWTSAHLRGVERALAEARARTRRDEQATARLADALREGTRRLLMLPASGALEGLPLLVRQLARHLRKEAEIVVRGAELEMDSRVLEQIKDPLIHLVRNAIDHGVETPEARRKAGKPAVAVITVSATPLDGNTVEITVADDGAGIDARRIRQVAVERRLLSRDQAEALDDAQALQLVFQSGFTSSPIVTDLSGRGLGLAIVAEKVQGLGGSVTLQTHPGRGARFVLTLPIAISSSAGILISVSGHRLIVPASAVERVARLRAAEIRTSDGRRSTLLNGRSLPVCSLAEVLALPREKAVPEGGHVPAVIIGRGDDSVALVVDEVLQNETVLVRRFSPPLLRVRNLAGATLLGSGELVPVLNASDVLKSARRTSAAAGADTAGPTVGTTGKHRVLVADDSITSRTLLRGVLESAGYEVRTAAHGLEALELLRRENFHLLVSDVEMPRLNGLDLTARVRRERRLAELPVVLVTALASDEDRARGIDVGASAYVVKSDFNQDNLLEIVRQLIS